MAQLAHAHLHIARVLRSDGRLACAVAVGTALAGGLVVPVGAEARPRARSDRDGDGLSNRYELKRSKTDPRRRDTDRDGLSDGAEAKRYRTNPRRRDTDRDGMSDGAEVKRYGTNPRRDDKEVRDWLLVPVGSPMPAPRPGPPEPDRSAPDTAIESGPPDITAATSATFRFSSNKMASRFECSLDGSPYGLCSSPTSYWSLGFGGHRFA